MKVIKQYVVILTVLILAACSPAGQTQVGDLSTPTPAPTAVPTATLPPTPEPLTPTQTPDVTAFVDELIKTLNSRDIETLAGLMPETFTIGYWQTESGTVSSADGLALMQADFLSGDGQIVLVPEIDPAAVGDLSPIETAQTERLVFTGGWGAAGDDQAVLAIGLDEQGRLYWQGILYARGGFDGIQLPVTETPDPTAFPTAAPPDTGSLVYESDFRTGWPELKLEGGSTSLMAEGYRVEVLLSLWVYTTVVEQSTFYAELEAEPSICPAGKALYGLLFHYVDDTHFRFFTVTCGAGYTLYERTGENSSRKIAEGELPAGADAGSGSIRLGVYAAENELGLYINDYRVGSVTTGDAPAGDVGIYAETVGGPIYLLFTRLTIWALPD